MKNNIFTYIISIILVVLLVAGGIYAISTFNNKNEDSDSQSMTTSSSIESSQQVSNSSATKMENLSYTNEFFPSLKLNYSDEWKFTTKTTVSNYDSLDVRIMKFTKDEVEVNVSLSPVFLTGCSSLAENNDQNLQFSNGIYKHKTKVEGQYSLSYNLAKEASCAIESQIDSNIPVENSDEYKEDFPNDSYVKYFFSIDVNYKNSSDDYEYLTVDLPQNLENDIDSLIKGFVI